MTQTKEVSVLVIGGGIGGLSTALGLARLGKPVHVLEQAQAFAEVGAGLQLAPNALKVLDKLGVLEAVYDYSVFPRRNVVMDAITGKELSALDHGPAFRERYGYPYAVLHRADLLGVLVDACKATGLVTMLTNHRVVSIEDLGERVSVVCANGNTYLAEILIGADGVKSKTRELICDDEPIFSECVAYRGTIPSDEITANVDVKTDEKITWIGPNIHLVQYSLRKKEIFNQVAVFKSFKYQKGLESADNWGTPEELDEAFSTSCPAVRKAVSYMRREIRWPMYDRAPLTNWSSGRITLLGDAAHAMVPYLAQGACQSLEDADCLVEKLHAFGTDYKNAFEAYQTERIPRATKVQLDARKMGHIKHTVDSTAILLRDYILTNRSSNDYSLSDWLFSPQDYRGPVKV